MNRLDKVIAVSLQAAAGVLMFTAGYTAPLDDINAVIFGLPAIASAVGGLLLWRRSAKAEPAATDARPVVQLDATAVHDLVASLQEEVNSLRDERQFFQQLYTRSGESDALLNR